MRAGPRRMARRETATGEESPPLGAPLRVETAQGQLWRGNQRLTLTPKAVAVLHYLLARPGQLVTKGELMRGGWTDTVVTDGALVACIRELRQALQDDAQTPQYIETVHRRGYRFIGPLITAPLRGLESRVQRLAANPQDSRLPDLQTPDPR